jgi:hypothetical protein
VPVGAVVLLILLVPFALAMTFVMQRGLERHREWLNRKPTPSDVTAGRCVTCIPVEVVVEHEVAMHSAETAIAKKATAEHVARELDPS